ncbi:MAG: hypothetical protein ACLFUS_02280 [Candidatus Sumerlaeia bacterium]
MIIGVTGFFCAGKDSFAEILMEKGLRHISLSDMIRDEIRRLGKEVNLENLTLTGNALRAEFGPGVLAQRALEKIGQDDCYVVTSIRHSKEVETLQQRPDFTMIFVDAPIKLRYERSLQRNRKGDYESFEGFAAAEKAQLESDDPNSQQLLACKNMAGLVVENAGSREELVQKAQDIIERLQSDSAK